MVGLASMERANGHAKGTRLIGVISGFPGYSLNGLSLNWSIKLFYMTARHSTTILQAANFYSAMAV